MLKLSQKKRLALLLRYLETGMDLICLLIMTVFFLRLVPAAVLQAAPATGGDTGSHFWTLYGLAEHALPNGGVRYWNPGNHGGEPRLLHYFPLPFLVMAFMAEVIPLGTAFNIGTIIASGFFPLCVYLGVRGLGFRFPAPIFATALAFFAHYNEGFSMWGGNTLSTLAGQFAHSYALNFLLIGIGALGWELRRGRFPVISSLCFAAVFLSHGYPALGVPFVLLAFLLFAEHRTALQRFVFCTFAGGFTLLLALWFLVPMQLNSPWQTPHDMVWRSANLLAEVYPPLLYPIGEAFLLVLFLALSRGAVRRFAPDQARKIAATIIPLAAILFMIRIATNSTVLESKPTASTGPGWILLLLQLASGRFVTVFIIGAITAILLALLLLRKRLTSSNRKLLFGVSVWLTLTVWFTLLYFILPQVHLIDIRAVPQVHLFGCIFVGLLLGSLLASSNRVAAIFLTLPFVLLSLNSVNSQVKNFPYWMEWNLSGWEKKKLWPEVQALSNSIRGDFSQPRIIYELSDKAQPTGTIRVWEMLPYFANRSTLESVYLEATLLSGEAVYLQAEISKFPSCPLPQYPCTRFNIPAAKSRFELMGVGGLILATDETKAQARQTDFLFEQQSNGPWTVFLTKEQPALVNVFQTPPKIYTSPEDWRRPFYEWFRVYDGTHPFLLAPERLSERLRTSLESNDPLWSGDSSCTPSVEVDFNRIVLRTNCPNKAHYLKFNYHPAWRTSTGDELFIVSPSFLGIVPTASEVVLEFGYLRSWQVSSIISWLSLGVVIGIAIFEIAGYRVLSLVYKNRQTRIRSTSAH